MLCACSNDFMYFVNLYGLMSAIYYLLKPLLGGWTGGAGVRGERGWEVGERGREVGREVEGSGERGGRKWGERGREEGRGGGKQGERGREAGIEGEGSGERGGGKQGLDTPLSTPTLFNEAD